MKRWYILHWSRLGIIVQFLVLIRPLAEYFRVKLAMGDAMQMADADPLVLSALLAAALTALGVGAHFLGYYRSSVVLAVLTVLAALMMHFALRA